MQGFKSGRGKPIRAPVAVSCFPAVVCCVALLLGTQKVACTRMSQKGPPQHETMPRPDINEVLRAHDQALLAIPGVVGVYVGVLDDEKTPCLKVMVVKKTPELEKRIPKSIEGYPVVIEETGVIRPMPKE
jgi:hypothetical protein